MTAATANHGDSGSTGAVILRRDRIDNCPLLIENNGS